MKTSFRVSESYTNVIILHIIRLLNIHNYLNIIFASNRYDIEFNSIHIYILNIVLTPTNHVRLVSGVYNLIKMKLNKCLNR